MYDISVIIPTARENYSIIGQPDLNILEITMNSLLKQTFKNFEVIIVDALHQTRDFPFDKIHIPYKHVPVHSNHRFWLDRKMWNVCGSLNTGLIHAEGEMIVRIDDCSEFDNSYLQRIWDEYQNDLWLQGMHIKYYKGSPSKNEHGQPIQDSRIPIVKSRGGRLIAHYEWLYGYSSFPLQAAIKINGFDELFDGDYGQEDQDFGSRLELAGYENKLLLDSNQTVIEHEHLPIPEAIVRSNNPNIKCNFAIFLLSRRKKQWKANAFKLTEEDIAFIRETSLKSPCTTPTNIFIDDCEGELFDLWVKNQNIFDLREERLRG